MSKKVIAHRGASGHAPENTCPAIEKAVEQGADMIELDVQAASDDVPVCVHDVRLERTTGDTSRVKKVSSGDMASLDAGGWFGPEFKGVPVPTLEQAAQAAGKTPLILRLRELPKGSGFEKNLRAIVEGRAAQTTIAVADSEAISRNKDWKNTDWVFLADEALDGWLVLEKSEKLGLKHLRVHTAQLDGRLIHGAREREMEVWVFYTDRAEEAVELAAKGVDGIYTNKPDVVKKALSAE